MAFPDDVLGIQVELLLDGVWTDITADVRGEAGIRISRGRRNEASQIEPGQCSLTLDNRTFKYSLRNPESVFYGLIGRNAVIRVSVLADSGTLHHRFTGEVSEWPPRWTEGALDVWSPIEAYGLLRRLRDASPPARDAMRRFTTAASVLPLAYWPMTEGSNARQATEVISGGPSLRALGPSRSLFQGQPTWGSGRVAPWLNPVAELTQRKAAGTLTTRVNLADVTGWAIDHVRSGTGLDENLYLSDAGQGTNADPSVRWQLSFDQDADTIEVWSNVQTDSGEVETLEDTITTAAIYDADPHHIRLSVADDGGGGTDWELYIDGEFASGGDISDATFPLASLTYTWAAEDTSESTEPVAIGHFTYWETAPRAIDCYRALFGHDRELAGRRIERLCAEDDIELRVHGDLDDTQEMGPQRPGTLLDLLDAAEAVDGGTVGEARDVLALEYRTGRSRYNQEVA